jgi:ATP-dependent helicase/nuclease subunit B
VTGSPAPRVFTIAPGSRFLHELADALVEGRLVPGFAPGDDPLALADVSIFVPTRRAARELRATFAARSRGRGAILPSIRPLGEFDDEAVLPGETSALAAKLDPPISSIERTLMLAPLVRQWKEALPRHLSARYGEEVVVPVSLTDAIWLARDLGALIDEVEREGVGWDRLSGLVDADLAAWWQVTLTFLEIVSDHWPRLLAAAGRSDPAAHRNALIDAETARLIANPPRGPVIAAGSTGSVPATARLLGAIARLDRGAVVLPGLDLDLDAATWTAIGDADAEAAAHGHPQFGLKRLLAGLGISREDVVPLGRPSPALAARATLISEALRPAATTDAWSGNRELAAGLIRAGAFEEVCLVEAATEREEALAIATALRLSVERSEDRAALVTPDRALARRVVSELSRFGLRADDSGGSQLADSPPATLFRLMLETAFRPGDPVALVSLLKHPLLALSMPGAVVRRGAEKLELVALRGGTGRPDVLDLPALVGQRLAALDTATHPPFWRARLDQNARREVVEVADAIALILTPLARWRGSGGAGLKRLLVDCVSALEGLGRSPERGLGALYEGEAGEAFAEFLRGLLAVEADLAVEPAEWPDLFQALVAQEVVKPAPGADPRIAILGTLEARLQSFDLVVLGGLNEGSWPARPDGDRFMSRIMKAGLSLPPPERRIGQAAHDFTMSAGAPRLILTRSLRMRDAPALPSRWLQRLVTAAGPDAAKALSEAGRTYIEWARALDAGEAVAPATRPRPTPPVEARPTSFSVTEIETLRRDPYALYARRVLALDALDPLLRDPSAAERGTLLHDIMHRFTASRTDPRSPDALGRLITIARKRFDEETLPPDVEAIWWPRFARLAPEILDWEAGRALAVSERHAELAARRTQIGVTGATLRGRADRIDMLHGGMADIIDYKTGTSPTKAQAHTLLAPQLALEAALLARGAFETLGQREPADLLYVRLLGRGEVRTDSILEHNRKQKTATELADDAWERLERMVAFYDDPANGYVSRALPFKESDVGGDYDHLARVLEWSAGDEPDESVE